MSAYLDMADAIKGRIESLAKLKGITVIVDRQRDLEAEVLHALERIRGIGVVVRWVGDEPVNVTDPVLMVSRYEVQIYSAAFAAKGYVSPDELIEAIRPALNDWHADPDAHSNDRMRTSPMPPPIYGQSQNNTKFSLHIIPMQCRIVLPDPEYLEP